MKKPLRIAGILSIALLVTLISGLINQAESNIAGAPAGYTGSPGDGGFTCATQVGCHTGAPVPTDNTIITSNVPPTGYIPGFTYTITAAFIKPGHSRFGFEISPQSASGTYRGTIIITNSTETQFAGTKYITHRTGGIVGSGSRTWTFNWIAPSAGTGSVTFYGCFNATNSSNTALGDSITKSMMTVIEDPHTGIQEHLSLEGTVSIFPNPASQNFTLGYGLRQQEVVVISISDLSGKQIAVLMNAPRSAGQHSEEIFLPESIIPGLYLLTCRAGNEYRTERLVVK